MQIQWPRHLIQEIAYRRCILFLGSGISSTATDDNECSPKVWSEFLNDAKAQMINPTPQELAFVDQMLEQKNFLMALQAIRVKCDSGQYGNYLKDVFSRPNFKASQVHKSIKEIDAKIIITTNFDKIYDNICNQHGYTVATYQEGQKILENIKTTENLIIKAHGSIDDVSNIVFTQQQYYEARKNYPDFYNILNALFLTNTILFLGYSLSDPDINLLLETVAYTSNPSCPHYIVVKQGVEKEIQNFWKDSYNISCLEYGPEYENLAQNINDLTQEVLAYRESKLIP